jgi:hypothetical protein
MQITKLSRRQLNFALAGAPFFGAPSSAQAPLRIQILRASYNSGSITGEMSVNGRFIAHTLELPWRNNQSYVSSIPAREYPGFLRYDKTDGWRIQLVDVPNRTGVQIHVGNYPTQIEGCVLVGKRVINARNEITDSALAYAELKSAFYGSANPVASPNVAITVAIAYAPSRTQFRGEDMVLSYQDQGRWGMTWNGRTGAFVETFRDAQNIVMNGSIGDLQTYLRVPLFGGVPAAGPSAQGPWDSGDASALSRTN